MEAMGLGSMAFRTPASLLATARRSPTKAMATRRKTTVFPQGEPGPRPLKEGGTSPVKLLTNVENLRLLSKAEKAGLLSTAERLGFSLSAIEKSGLLSKAEDLGLLSAAVDPNTPSSLLTLSIVLLLIGPAFVFVVPEDQSWEIAAQVAVALTCIVGGSVAFAASNFVSSLQRSA